MDREKLSDTRQFTPIDPDHLQNHETNRHRIKQKRTNIKDSDVPEWYILRQCFPGEISRCHLRKTLRGRVDSRDCLFHGWTWSLAAVLAAFEGHHERGNTPMRRGKTAARTDVAPSCVSFARRGAVVWMRAVETMAAGVRNASIEYRAMRWSDFALFPDIGRLRRSGTAIAERLSESKGSLRANGNPEQSNWIQANSSVEGFWHCWPFVQECAKMSHRPGVVGMILLVGIPYAVLRWS
jgi:hypothetical protein